MRKWLAALAACSILITKPVTAFGSLLENTEPAKEISSDPAVARMADDTVLYGSAKTGAALTLDGNGWRIADDGNTGAMINGDTLVSNGYSGIVTLTDGTRELTVHLLGGNKWRPGLNILTGTTEPMDITEENGALIVGENADIRAVENASAAAVNPVAQYETCYGAHFFPIEEMSFDRRLLIGFDFSGASDTTRFIVNSSNELKYYYDFGSKNNVGSWDTYRYDGKASTNATSAYTAINKLGFVICWSSYVEAYFDNYLFIPFYKITYSGAKNPDVYFLFDEDGQIASSYPVDPSFHARSTDRNMQFVGWSTEQNALEAMDTVPLCNEDVVLYPVWRLKNAVAYDLALEGPRTATITADEQTYAFTGVFSADVPDKSIVWTVDDPTLAKIDENGVLTPLDEGVVTVTATASYYPYKSASQTVEIRYPQNAEFVKVSFTGNVKQLPKDFTLLKGKRLKLAEYMNCISAEDGKRFNGWSHDGELLLDDILPQEDTVLEAVISEDYNFAVKSNLNDWRYNVGSISQRDGVMVCTYDSTHNDPYITNDTLQMDTAKYQAIEYLLDVNYTENGAARTLKTGDTLEGTYFARTGEGIAWQRQVKGSVISVTADGKYALARCDMHENAYWEGTLQTIRFDFIGNAAYSFGVRYIRFIPRDVYEEKTIQIKNIDIPVTGRAPDTDAMTVSANQQITSVIWAGTLSETGRFVENTAYRVIVNVSAADKIHRFSDDCTAFVNGKEASVTVDECGSAVITYTFDKTEPLIPFEAEITGADVIGRKDRSFVYSLKLTSEHDIPDKSAVFSVDKPEIAEVDADSGSVTAKKNGVFTLTAVSSYNPDVVLHKTVTVKGIDDTPARITFHPGTLDTASVTDMPADILTTEFAVSLTKYAPQREGYVFLGWSPEEDSLNVTETVQTGSDTDLYAVWGKGIAFEFNGTDHGVNAGSCSTEIGETHLTVKTDAKQLDARLNLPVGMLDPKKFGTVEVKMAVETDSMIEVFFSADGSGLYWANAKNMNHTPAGLDKDIIYTFDFSSMSSWRDASVIDGIWVDPFQSYDTTALIDYIRILDPNRLITFDTCGGRLLAGSQTVTAAFGSTLPLTQKAEKDGHVFLGWSKEPDGEPLSSLFVGDDLTLYAVYGQNVPLADDGTAAYAENMPVSDSDAILVKASAGAVVSLSLDGSTQKQTANAAGYAVFPIAQTAAFNRMEVTSADGIVFVCLTAERTARAIAGNVSALRGKKSGEGAAYEPDMTVITVESEREAYNTDSESGNAASGMDSSKPIFFGFDRQYEKNLFTITKNASVRSVQNSVMTVDVLSKSGADMMNMELTTPDIAFNADTHRYIIVRARGFGLDNPRLRIRFHKAFDGFSNIDSVRNRLDGAYQTLVYDMAKCEKWFGTVEQIQFLLESNTGGTVDIDWILFTDEIPEDTAEYDLASDAYTPDLSDDMPFEDVAAEAWYFENVYSAYKRGLVKGRTANTYDPKGNVTAAEVITLAVRLRCESEGMEVPQSASGEAWYEPYLAAAKELGIDDGKRFAEYTAPASRRDVAVIMARTLRDTDMKAMNYFVSIPDVPSKDKDKTAIFKLYNAGVLTGVDRDNTFMPDTSVTRAEMACIVMRMAVPAARIRVYTEDERLANRVIYTGAELVNGISKSVSLESMTLKNGMAATVSKTGDPNVYFGKMLGAINGSDISKITIGIQWDTAKARPSLQLFFAGAGDNWSESRMVKGVVTGTDETGMMTVEFNVAEHKDFHRQLEDLRFDPFDAAGVEFAIGYIMIE